MAPASSKNFLDIQANYRVWIHSETPTRHDNKIQSTATVVTAGNGPIFDSIVSRQNNNLY